VRPGVFRKELITMYKNTEFCCDLKTILRRNLSMQTGRDYQGVLRRDWDADADEFRCRDAHYTFVETLPWTGKRNPHVFRDDNCSLSHGRDGRWYFCFSLDEDQLPLLPQKLLKQASAIAQKVMRELVLVEKDWKPFGVEW